MCSRSVCMDDFVLTFLIVQQHDSRDFTTSVCCLSLNINECLSQPVHRMCVCTCLNCTSYALFHTWLLSISQRLQHGRSVEKSLPLQQLAFWCVMTQMQESMCGIPMSYKCILWVWSDTVSMLLTSSNMITCCGSPHWVLFALESQSSLKHITTSPNCLPPGRHLQSICNTVQPWRLIQTCKVPLLACGLRTNSASLWLRLCTKSLWWD